MKDVTICFIYFRSLTLENLEASLYSLWKQNLDRVKKIVVLDNNTEDSAHSILSLIEDWRFGVPVSFHSVKHGDSTKTHAWSTNTAVREVETPWVFFTRADYLLHFHAVEKMLQIVDKHPSEWNGFVTGCGCHLSIDIARCNSIASWRWVGPSVFSGEFYDYTHIDTGVWLARKQAVDTVGGVDERLTMWGHSQTHFQWKLFQSGVEFVRVPETLFFHPAHGAEKDLAAANLQLHQIGVDIREMWKRYDGPAMY